jgi:hypothetical protein
VVTEIVALIGGAPKLASGGVDSFAHAVADAVGVNLLEFAIGRVLEHIGAVELAWMGIGFVDIGARAGGDEKVFAVLDEGYFSRPMAAASQLHIAGDVRNDGFGRARGV